MGKKGFRTVVLILVLSMILGTVSLAAEPRASSYIVCTSASVTATGGGNLLIEFAVTGWGTMTKIGAQTIWLYDEDGTLVKMFNYMNQDYSNMMGSNTFEYGSSVTYEGESGVTYYAIVDFYAKNSNGYDIVSYTTSLETA